MKKKFLYEVRCFGLSGTYTFYVVAKSEEHAKKKTKKRFKYLNVTSAIFYQDIII